MPGGGRSICQQQRAKRIAGLVVILSTIWTAPGVGLVHGFGSGTPGWLRHLQVFSDCVTSQTYNPLPIPASAVPAAHAVAPMMNYTDASNVDGLSPPLFALAGRDVDFSLRVTGDAATLPRQACAGAP